MTVEKIKKPKKVKEILPPNDDAKYERETTINGSDGDPNWELDTFQRKIITRLEKAGILPISIDEKTGRHHYKFKYNRLSFRKEPSGNKKPMSQERKDANAKRLAAGREAKKKSQI